MKKIIVTIALSMTVFCLGSPLRATAGEVEYTYDSLNRLHEVTYNNQAKITYTHDNVHNRQTEVTDSDNDGNPDQLDNFPDDPTK